MDTTPYQQGYDAGFMWQIGSNLPSPPPIDLKDAHLAIHETERLSQWFQGFNDGVQQSLLKREPSSLYDTPDNRIDILYGLARLCRNTDGLFPSTQGNQIGQLLVKLRILDGKTYDEKVMNPHQVNHMEYQLS